jgi:hypothetical protein
MRRARGRAATRARLAAECTSPGGARAGKYAHASAHVSIRIESNANETTRARALNKSDKLKVRHEG